jgi:hypothetical protein
MKINKIMTDLLKLVDKQKTLKCNYSVDDDYIYYIPDGVRVFKISKDQWLIDLKKALPNKTPLNNPGNFFKVDSSYEEGHKTNNLKSGDKMTIVKIESENSHAWINIDYLKEFEHDCTFEIGKPNQPVFVYEQGEVVGIILPVNVKEDLANE